MPMTYEQHVAAVLAEHPDPPIVWHEYQEAHEDGAHIVAIFDAEYLGGRWMYQISALVDSRSSLWRIIHDRDPDAPHPSQLQYLVYATGDSLAAVLPQFVTFWAEICANARAPLAADNLIREILHEAGIRHEGYSEARLSGLTISGGATLIPPFDPDTVTYTARTILQQVTLNAMREQPGATMSWMMDESATAGDASVVDLGSGATIITATVTAEDGTTAKVYTITITRT